MNKRTIGFNLEGDKLTPDSPNAGYAGEHFATLLRFNLPEGITGARYYVLFQTADGGKLSTPALSRPVEVSLPQAVMVEGKLKVQLAVVTDEDENGKEEMVRSAVCDSLVVRPSIIGAAKEVDDAYGDLLDSRLVRFDEAMLELEEKLSDPEQLKGDPGKPGETPNITVGTTTTGEPGTNAVVTQTGTQLAPVLNFVIPAGKDGRDGIDGTNGSDGKDGKDGPTVTVLANKAAYDALSAAAKNDPSIFYAWGY